LAIPKTSGMIGSIRAASFGNIISMQWRKVEVFIFFSGYQIFSIDFIYKYI
jgi:hypothetical protein